MSEPGNSTGPHLTVVRDYDGAEPASPTHADGANGLNYLGPIMATDDVEPGGGIWVEIHVPRGVRVTVPDGAKVVLDSMKFE